MDLEIRGRRAAVAAGSAGLGFATAEALAREGVRVALCGRDGTRVQAAVERIGEHAVGLVADVSSETGARGFVERAIETLGGVDILVTNAGGPPPGNFSSTEFAAYPDALSLNLLSVVSMCQAAVPAMRERRWGRVLAITSVAVRAPIAGLILSNTARAGATGFLKTLAREIAADGVTVNSLQPGLHRTDRLHQLHGDGLDDLAHAVPSQQLGRPEDFGRFAAFLCSDHARFVTGSAIPVDGGAYPGLL